MYIITDDYFDKTRLPYPCNTKISESEPHAVLNDKFQGSTNLSCEKSVVTVGCETVETSHAMLQQWQ